ncbi:unnamed protein product, partial [Brachionus calyciflorus]
HNNNRYRYSNFDYSRLTRSNPQPIFSQNINYNVPPKKFLLNNETNPVNYQNSKNQKRSYYRNRHKPKKSEQKNDIFNLEKESGVPNVNNPSETNTLVKKEIELDDINPNKLIEVQAPVQIDENLIKLNLHKTQTNKQPTSLYENFVKSATKKESNSNKNPDLTNLDNLELNLSNLSLSSNETSSSCSKANSFKTNRASSIFDNLSNIKKSDSFGNKSLNDVKTASLSNLKSESHQPKKKNRRKNRKNQTNQETNKDEEFDFSNTNDFWEDEEHLVIGQNYYDSELDFDLEFDFDKE